MTRALQATRLGSSLPGLAGQHRGGTGLIVGRLTVHRDHLVPATLVAAKWGRVRATAYGAGIADPVSLTLELNPLYYESFLADTEDVTDGGQFQFEPEVSPAMFLVDIGSANKRVHGVESSGEKGAEAAARRRSPLRQQSHHRASLAPGASLPSLPAQQQQQQLALLSSPYSGGGCDGEGDYMQSNEGDARPPSEEADGTTRARARVAARLPYDALKRHEIREAVKQARRRAEEFLLGLARVGDDAGIEAVLTKGYRCEYTPHPW